MALQFVAYDLGEIMTVNKSRAKWDYEHRGCVQCGHADAVFDHIRMTLSKNRPLYVP